MSVPGLAHTVRRLGEEFGVHDPSAEEIAREYFGSEPGPTKTETVRAQIIEIRNYLRDRHGHNEVHLVSGTYYERFRDILPTTSQDARLCLPVGYGKRSEGVRFPVKPDDPIWLASIGQNYATSAGKAAINLERLATALKGGMISERAFREVIQIALDRGAMSVDRVKAVLIEHDLRISLPTI